MTRKARMLAQGGLLAALYLVLTHAQNLLLPGTASLAIQFRLSEALCVTAFFTPAAIPGLTVGCFLFNLTFGGALPLDWLVGSCATLLACAAMRLMRKHPLWALLMPALFNAPLVGWELAVFLGGGFAWPVFAAQALNVFIGEAAVMYTAGWGLYAGLNKRRPGEIFR